MSQKDEWFPAPDLVGLDNWINSEWYDSLTQLRGKVVMIDFWNLWCPSCIINHKDTNKIYNEFQSQGLEIIGLHAPDFASEKNIAVVLESVDEFQIKYPVALDNDFETWKAYNNRYWPAFYIIDKKWYIRDIHFWEWWYEEKRDFIIKLLAE